MFHAKYCKKVVHSTLRHLTTHLSVTASVSYCNYTRSKLLRTLLPNVVQCRQFMEEPSDESKHEIIIPPLFEEPKLYTPSFLKSIKNQLTIGFLLPRIDKEFNLSDFLAGSKQALVVVTDALAREDYESIKGLVTDETIQDVRNKVSMLNPEQKQYLAVQDEDIFIVFPYEVGIMFDNNKASEKSVEITVVFHSYRNCKYLEVREPSILMGLKPEFRKNIFITNLRFIRDYTKDVESSWIINRINHFMLLSMLND